MSDIICLVCGEPWDAYGVHHGDMMAWEARLFKAGAGCPSCAGVAPTLPKGERDELELASMRSMSDGWDDPDSFPAILDAFEYAVTGRKPTRPAWCEPPRKVVWTCAGCSVQCVEALRYSLSEENDADQRLEWLGGEKVHYSHGYAHRYPDVRGADEPEDVAPHEIAGKPYCSLCAQVCSAGDCKVRIFRRKDLEGDSYDAGSAFTLPDEYHNAYCVNCFEKLEAERMLEEIAYARVDLARDVWRARESGDGNETVRKMIAERLRRIG